MTRIAHDGPALDQPWRRPGAARYAAARLAGFARSSVSVYEPPVGTVLIDRDVPVATRDATTLRVNVHRPSSGGPFPVVLCAHPYGKDNVPARTRGGRGRYRASFQYRVLRQTSIVRFSSLTSWEAPDPVWWVGQGYAVVNCDLRGAGTSDGRGALLSDQEGEDVFDLIEWAAAQPWSTGSVGLLGVSYLALSQWKAAALRPPSLRAICPWEGFTDAYRDLLRPGGIEEVGFVKLWGRGVKTARLAYQLGRESDRRPLREPWWQSLAPELAGITVPALICGSFSDNNLHSRGSIRGFEQIGSVDKHLYTHRSGKWATFYSPGALQTQVDFFDRHLKGADTAVLPAVRLEVRDRRDHVVEVRDEQSWPLPTTRWTPLHLTDTGLSELPAAERGSITFEPRRHGVRFGWTVPADTELTGPMALRLFVETRGVDDIDLFVGVEKWRGSTYVPFEGSYGYGRDRVATGWQKVSLRALDPELSRPFAPVTTCTSRQPLAPGQVEAVDIALGPSATLFRQGERLRLVIAGRWLSPKNPLTGQFPAAYRSRPAGHCTVHWGPDRAARLLVPVIPPGLPQRLERPTLAGGR